jgi:hypothetical protein
MDESEIQRRKNLQIESPTIQTRQGPILPESLRRNARITEKTTKYNRRHKRQDLSCESVLESMGRITGSDVHETRKQSAAV